MLIEEIRCESC